jgi:hypothetical protein
MKCNDFPPSEIELWRSVGRKMTHRAFVGVLHQLKASNKILFDGKGRIVWVAVDNPKLEALLKASTKLRA